MGKANRVVGYLASVASASLFYLVWFVLLFEPNDPPGQTTSVQFKIGLGVFFLVLYGPGAAFALMPLPLALGVLGRNRLQHFGLIYYSTAGAATALVVGCATSSLSPKLLIVEDQTFLEGFVIAVQRQGVCLLLTGFLFGLTFWLVSERLRYTETPTN
jgi:hypothetical protein